MNVNFGIEFLIIVIICFDNLPQIIYESGLYGDAYYTTYTQRLCYYCMSISNAQC